MLKILYCLLVLPFYVRNAGTFAVAFYFAFGFMRPMDHEALMDAALGSPFLLSLLGLGWTLFAARTVSFMTTQLAAPAHVFLQTMRLMPARTRWAYWLVLMTELLAVVILYAGWMVARAVRAGAWGGLAAVVAAVLALVVAGAWAVDYRLRHPAPTVLRLPGLKFRLPYELFFLTHWLRHEPLSLLLTKLISGGLLLGVCQLYPTDDYDQRLLLIGLLLAIITHSQVGWQLRAFEQRYLLLLPNLPFSRWQRFVRYALIYGLVWLPELLMLLRNGPVGVSPGYVAGLWLTGWGGLLLLHNLARGWPVMPPQWPVALFAAFIGGLVAIMFGLPLVAWAAMGWLGALGLVFWLPAERYIPKAGVQI